MKKRLWQILSALLCVIFLMLSCTSCGGDTTVTAGGGDTGTTASSGDGNSNPSDPSQPSDPTPENPPAHEHTYSDEWSKNDTHHWHAATCEHADEKSDHAAHNYTTSNFCTACSYEFIPTEGLEYTLNSDNQSYSVTGIGTVDSANIAIPAIYEGLPVTDIGFCAFVNCVDLISVTIANGVTLIDMGAFGDCANLTTIALPESLTSIHEGAFFECTSLTSVTIPDSVTSIEAGAFDGCINLMEFVDDSIAYVDNWVIAVNPSATNLTLRPNTVGIADQSFSYDGSMLISVTLPESLKFLGEEAFANCKNLTSITMPDSIRSIGGHAFKNCSSLESLTIPNSVTSIGGTAFAGCTKLTSITIGAGVTSIDHVTFQNCSSLATITVNPANSVYHNEGNCLIKTADKTLILGSNNSIIPTDGTVTSIAYYAFVGREGLTRINIPNSITSIGHSAFSGCSSLTSIVIPDSVTNIGDYTFYNCTSLKSVTIPDSVTSIGFYAFEGCSSLTTVYYTGTAEEWASITIDSFNTPLTSATIYYYSETQPTDTIYQYWHYDENGIPTVW